MNATHDQVRSVPTLSSSRTERAPPLVIETRYGSLDILPPETDMISRFLSETGEWALDEAWFIASLLEDGARVLDGGAFLGSFGLGVAEFRKLGQLCCVEANPAILPLLEANLRRNADCPAVALGLLLAGNDGETRLGRSERTNLGATSFATGATGEPTRGSPAPGVTLQALRACHGEFDLIKLDLEGMELEVLKADATHLAKGTTALWIECNEGPMAPALAELLLSWKLDLWYFAFPSHNAENFLGRREPIFPWAYEAGLLAAPPRTPLLDARLASHGCILKRIDSLAALRNAMWQTPRWLPSDLAEADKVAIAGVASHALQGLSQDDFLSDERVKAGQQAGPRAEAVTRERPQQQAQALREARALAAERLAELEATQQLRQRTQNGLEHAQDLVISQLAELDRERRMRRVLEQRLAQQTANALDQLSQVDALTKQLEALTKRLADHEVANAPDRLAQITALAAQVTDLALARDLAEVATHDALAQLHAIRSTLAWRAASRAHRYIGRHPHLRRALRGLRAGIGTMLGRR
jgi:FkbM family methyltransferase